MFKEMADELGTLVSEKNAAYGNSAMRTAALLQVLYPNGIKPSQYPFALLTVRVLDKLSRDSTHVDEENWKDIAGYGLLGWRMAEITKP